MRRQTFPTAFIVTVFFPRIFGKKDKSMKSRTGGFVTAPLSAQPHYGETEMVQVRDSVVLIQMIYKQKSLKNSVIN